MRAYAHDKSLNTRAQMVRLAKADFWRFPMFFAMLFMFCFFIGSMAMFLYLLWRLDGIAHILSDEHAQMRVLLRAMESRLDKISHVEKISAILQGQTEDAQEANAKSAHDSLLHLSFEKPQDIKAPVDPGLDLNMDEQGWELPDARPRT